MAFNDTSTPLSLLRTRRSGKPRDMAGPGPGPEQLEAMIGIAARTPDHGKLFPWRFVIVPPVARAALGERLVAILRSEKPDCTARDEEAALQFASQAPARCRSSPRFRGSASARTNWPIISPAASSAVPGAA